MIACFDTSVINQLADDPRREELVATILSEMRVYITALSVIEIAKTTNVNRRERLRQLAKTLAKNLEPLALPNDLLESVARAFQSRAESIVITIPPDQRELWFLFSQPNALLEGGREEITRWAKANERLHDEPAAPLRDQMDRLFAAEPTKRPRGPADVLRQLLAGNWDLHYSLPSQFYKLATGRVLPLSRLEALLEAGSGIWSVFLASVALSVYYAAVWVPAHGLRSTVGVLDLWSAAYLPLCDIFVTNDLKNGGQYEALRIANTLNRRRPRTRVLRWSEFRAALLSGVDG
jgi:predicted nucleic acid-binding protein